VDRRQFLASTVPAAALVHSDLGGLLFGGAEDGESHAPMRAYDLVVVGGSLVGCFAAIHAARRGLRVLLVERRTFLATDITATLRPWLVREGFEAFDRPMRELFLPAAERIEVGVPFDPSAADDRFDGEIPLFCGSVKKQFMRALLTGGVDVLLMTGVWGVVADRNKQTVSGLALANKAGLQIVRCKGLIDTRSMASPGDANRRTDHAFCLELYGVRDDVGRVVSVPRSLGLKDHRIVLHRGKRMPGQCFLEFRFSATPTDAEPEARRIAEALCTHLIANQDAFAKASVAQMAWETLDLSGRGHGTRPHRYRNGVALPEDGSAELSCEAVLAMKQRAETHVQDLSLADDPGTEPQFIHHPGGAIPLSVCALMPMRDLRTEDAIWALAFSYEQHVPEMLETDLVVAGGGTAGAPAALAALERGARVATVEYFPELGGTKTVGGVMGYYWGYRQSGVFRKINEAVKEQNARLGGRSSRVSMMLLFRKGASRNGGILMTSSIICGVLKEGERVAGLVVEKDGGLTRVRGRVVVDATGDADVAAFAGAAWDFGNRRMEATQNYSQWDVNPGLRAWEDSSTNRDYDILANCHMSEVQRGYQLTHQEAHHYDFMPMLTVRESRRIRGECTITLKDVIENRHYHDAVSLATSDFDPHHFGDTELTRVGCLLPHGISAVVEIPYRALIPKGLDGLLVSAKAISQTHNALQFTRMSMDIMTLGYVTGCIGADVCRRRVSLRDFDVRSLRDTLSEMNLLREDPRKRQGNAGADNEHIAERIEALAADGENSLIRVLALPGEKAEPLLAEHFESTNSRSTRLRLAKALAWFGNPLGNALLVQEMNTLFEQEQERGSLPWEYYRKDKGTPYWTINQDIALLGLSGDRSALRPVLTLADSLKLENPPVRQETAYNRGRIDLRLIPYYNRLINVCFTIERMPDGTAIRTLERFLNDPYIKNGLTAQPGDAREKVYAGILESRIAATLARCGARRGYEVLTRYLDDVHEILAGYARSELRSLLPQDHGDDARRWAGYIQGLSFPRPIAPRQPDAVEW
jgi:ribulose 1,5-bisphosphate synthetase/thiazole synthase